jgi:4-hydroxyacetophenone monooxygenase
MATAEHDAQGLPPLDEAALDQALEAAHPACLVMTLVQLTGDMSWLSREQPVYIPFQDDRASLSPAFQAEVREALKPALRSYWREGLGASPPDADAVGRMMAYVAGTSLPPRYVPFLMEELALDGADPRRPDWSAPELAAAAAGLKVIIVGAGMSGLLAAIRLQQAGVDFEIIEKNSDVGGTWLENVYPGVRVDTPNHLYSYSFEPNHDWPLRYSTGDVLLEYFRKTADKHALRQHIRFGATVERCVWDEAEQIWRVHVRSTDEPARTMEARALIVAVGQLNQPRTPDFVGRETFAGDAFHSARWPKDFDASGRRVAVIGAGASAFQFVPQIAQTAAHVTIFQRTPPWLAPTSDYHEAVPAGKRALLEHLPFYERWYRFYLFWTATDGVYEAVKADPDWTGGPEAVGAANAALRADLIEAIKPQLAGREDLLEKVVPKYPFGGKRALRDNGVWLDALRRPTVELVTTPIERIAPEGVVTRDGRLWTADALIYGTGFEASSFLKTLDVQGRDGRTLHGVWDGDARSYLGVTTPGFPNFFVLYGPNTNIVVNGSIIFFSECAVRYVLGCLKLLAQTGSSALEVRQDVSDAFNAEVDAANAKMAWGAPQVSSWYKNARGRVSQNWPYPLVDYWSATRSPNPEDYQLTPGAA